MGPMENFDGILFDLDGTLWDSTKPITTAWNLALGKMEKPLGPVSEQDVQGIMGLPNDKIFEKIFPQERAQVREEISNRCRDEELSILREMGAPLFPGVEQGLKRLAEKFPLFVVSNCESDYLKAFFVCTGFHELFRDSECHGNTLKSKAENLKLVVERNGLKCPVYIGDTAGDHAAADAAGMTYFHVNYGFGNPRGECLTFDKFPDLVAFLMKD